MLNRLWHSHDERGTLAACQLGIVLLSPALVAGQWALSADPKLEGEALSRVPAVPRVKRFDRFRKRTKGVDVVQFSNNRS